MRQILAVGVFVICPILPAQTASPESSTLVALKDEVHELRLAIERSTLLGARTQIAIERIRAQEARVAQATQRLGEVRQGLARYQAGRNELAMHQKDVEDRLSEATNPQQRRALENEMRGIKRQLEDAAGDAEIRTREGEIARQLQTEQGLLAQFESEMSQLTSALDRAIQQIEGPRKP